MAQAHGGAEWAELVFHHPPETSEGRGGARARRRVCEQMLQNTGQSSGALEAKFIRE